MKERIEELLNELHNLQRNYKQARTEKLSDSLNISIRYKKIELREQSLSLVNLLARVQTQLSKGDAPGLHSSIPLIDYTCNFNLEDQISAEGFILGDDRTDYTQVVTWFLSGSAEHISQTKDRIKYRGYFTVKDVLIDNYAKPSYMAQMKQAEKKVKELCLFDQKGYTTELNRLLHRYSCIYGDNNNEFSYIVLIEFLKDLLNGNYREEILKETKYLVRNHPHIIKKLRLADLG
jgi:hypothetical protein